MVRATPVAKPFTSAHVSTPDQHTSGTTSGLSFLSTHMQNFKKRMFQLRFITLLLLSSLFVYFFVVYTAKQLGPLMRL